MALADLNAHDYLRLVTAFKAARDTDKQLIPTVEELIPAIREALDKDGKLVDNIAVVLGRPVVRAFDLVRSLISEKHGETYADDLWDRFLKKGT